MTAQGKQRPGRCANTGDAETKSSTAHPILSQHVGLTTTCEAFSCRTAVYCCRKDRRPSREAQGLVTFEATSGTHGRLQRQPVLGVLEHVPGHLELEHEVCQSPPRRDRRRFKRMPRQ